MGVFQSEKSFSCDPALINAIANRIVMEFQRDGYECALVPCSYGTQVSIRKGGIFKAVLGLKTALNVSITPLSASAINIKAGVGLFQLQAIPTAIMWFAFWPVIVTQIWGLVQQSHLDDQVMVIAEKVIAENSYHRPPSGGSSGSDQGLDAGYGRF